ncbi:MAG: DUF354 domain-containing protein [Alphaproteobacteria bacterium]|nr:DUF354 domain-containing protein [Alphaproteobacteria bacterium]
MRVALDLLHPAHVHFFRPLRQALLAHGHQVLVASRRKDCTVELLDGYGIEHHVLSTQRKGVPALAAELAVRSLRLRRLLRGFRPDALLGIMGPTVAVVGRTLPGCRTAAFYDNESAGAINRFVQRSVDRYCTPEGFVGDGGPRHVRYRGYHELAYLHPARFTPDRAVVERYGLGDEPLFLLRFVAWESIHDIGEAGLSLDVKRELVRRLSARGRVVISSESPLPDEFEPWRLRIDVRDVHHVLACCDLVVGESSTMASEAACLGTHALFVSRTGRGINDEQEARYGIVHTFDHTMGDRVLERVEALLSLPDTKRDAKERQRRLLDDNIDVTGWMLDALLAGRLPGDPG